MKAVFISVGARTRGWNAGLFPWSDGVAYAVPSQPGILTDGPLSQCGNRNCTHLSVDTSTLSSVDTEDINLRDYTDPSYPAIRYLSDYGALSSVGSDSLLSLWTYTFGSTVYTEQTELRAEGSTIVYYKLSQRHVDGVLVYSWEGNRIFDIVEDVYYAEFREEYTMYNYGDTSHGVNTGTQPIGWKNVVPATIPDWFNPQYIFGDELWNILLKIAYKRAPKSANELSSDCMDGFYGPVNNGIQYTAEMTQLSSLARPLAELIQGGPTPSRVASAYLSYEYGARLSAKDTYSYISKLRRQRNVPSKRDYSRLYARNTTHTVSDSLGLSITFTRNLTLYYVNASDFLRSVERVRRAGFMPSLEIAWDIVPFSFIVDWFTPIGEAVNAFDKRGIYDSYQWLEHVLTDKISISIDIAKSPIFPGKGHVTLTGYYRRVAPHAPKPSMRFDDLNLSGRQIRNGAAILFQNWK